MKKNAIICHKGKLYCLINDAYREYNEGLTIAYEAYAFSPQDKPDKYGYQPAYLLYWDVKDEYIDYDPNRNGKPYLIPDCPDDESLLADWDNPSGVIDGGDYNAATKELI